MRAAHWDIQTHDRSDWDPVESGVTRIMNTLQQHGRKAAAIKVLNDNCREIAAYLDGRYPSYRADTMDSARVEHIIRKELSPYYQVPALLLPC